MSTFTKWIKLPSELQDHSLSYNCSEELGEYAQLSDSCNKQIQKFNKIAPVSLSVREIKNGNDEITICAQYPSNHYFCLHFVAASENTHKFVRSKRLIESNDRLDNHQILDGNARESAFNYLEKFLKHTKATRIGKIIIDCEEWPNEALKRIPAVLKVTNWKVCMYPSMYDAFMTFMNEAIYVKNVSLHAEWGNPSSITLPASFFKSSFFKRLENADIDMKSMIADEDFLSSKAKFLELKCDTITENAINQKIRNWHETKIALGFQITLDPDRRFNQNVIRQNLPFSDGIMGWSRIRRHDGKEKLVRIFRNGCDLLCN